MTDFRGLETLNSRKDKRSSKAHIYIIAGIAGISAAGVLIMGIRVLIFLVKVIFVFVKNYWIWIIIGIIGLLLLKKLLSKKRVEVHKEMPNQEQYY